MTGPTWQERIEAGAKAAGEARRQENAQPGAQCDVCGAYGCDLLHPRFRGNAQPSETTLERSEREEAEAQELIDRARVWLRESGYPTPSGGLEGWVSTIEAMRQFYPGGWSAFVKGQP